MFLTLFIFNSKRITNFNNSTIIFFPLSHRQVLSYQENLHLLESKNEGDLLEKPPSKSFSPRSPQLKSPRSRLRQNQPPRSIPAEISDFKTSNNLRLDPVSLKAIARIVDDKIVDREDRFLGQMKALVDNAISPNSSPPRKSDLNLESINSEHFPDDLKRRTNSTTKTVTIGHKSSHNNKSILPDLQQNMEKGIPSANFGKKTKLPWMSTYKTESDHPQSEVKSDDNSKRGNHHGIRYPQCRSTVYRPTAIENGSDLITDELIDSSPPSSGLTLKHVHAYSGDTARHGGTIKGKNIMFVGTKRVIYPAAALVVVLDIGSDEQGYFSGHTEDVTCITVHPDRAIAASGQIGKDGRILIWDSSTISAGSRQYNADIELFMLGGTRGVCGLNFSGDGRFLVALGMDECHTMVIFDWATAQIIASVKVGHNNVNQMGFNPYLFSAVDRIDELKMPSTPRDDKNLSESCCYTLVSCGGRQIKFWTLKRTLARSEDNVSELSGFKGRKIPVPKKKQNFAASYTLEGNNAVFPKNGTDIPDILCFVCVNDGEGGSGSNRHIPPKSRIFTGTSSGSVYIWQHLEDASNSHSLTDYSWQSRGRLLSVVSDVHDSPILDIDYTGAYWYADDEDDCVERITTCSKDGIANVWKMDRTETDRGLPFEHSSTINIGYSESNVGSPRCISWDMDGSTILVGTTGNALIHLFGEGLKGNSDHGELQSHIYVKPLVRGHHGKILRVAAHPTEPIFATVSTDKTIRLWNASSKSQISLTRLAERASALEFTPDGSSLAVGNENGEILIISYTALNSSITLDINSENEDSNQFGKQWQVTMRRHVAAKFGHTEEECLNKKVEGSSYVNKKKSEVTELKFSPDGETLAVGCRDNLIHLLSTVDSYKRVGVCRGHSSHIKNLDFSTDSQVIQAVDAVREILYWDVATGKQICNASQVRDVIWHSLRCTLGWSVQGIFNGPAGIPIDGEMNAVYRSNGGSLLVAGGSNTVNSAVKLFRYPCTSKAIPSLHGGHTSPVLDVAFLANDNEIITIGGSDSTIFCWSL